MSKKIVVKKGPDLRKRFEKLIKEKGKTQILQMLEGLQCPYHKDEGWVKVTVMGELGELQIEIMACCPDMGKLAREIISQR